MKLTRRQLFALSAAGIATPISSLRAEIADGKGPNRGIAKRGWRSKHTCINESVLLSDGNTRISGPDDFGGSSCEMLKDSFEGPYFTCSPSLGKEIAADQNGVPLTIALRLIGKDCQPVPNGVIDIWACNADGYYSGYSNDPDKMPPMFRAMLLGHVKPDTADRFCRGALRTDADGIAEFNTIYPGYYYGQPIHVHFKVHLEGKNLLTSQANFPEIWNEKIMKSQPYNSQRSKDRNVGQSGFPVMQIVEKGSNLLAVLDLVAPF